MTHQRQHAAPTDGLAPPHPALPVRHPGRTRVLSVSADRVSTGRLFAGGGVMSDLASASWLGERPDRSELVLWLAVNVARGGAFLFQALADLLDRGFLTEAQEAAVRRCRARGLVRGARFRPYPRRRSDTT